MAGYQVEATEDGQAALDALAEASFDLAILDIMVPGPSGLEVLASIRQHQPALPVIMLSALEDEKTQIDAFNLFADDYVTKPFETAEVLFRLRALVRRSHGHAHPVLRIGDLAFDTHTGSVTRAGCPVSLTAQEARLLAYLAHAAPRVVSRSELAEHVYDRDHEPDSNVIDVQVSRLRRKLGAAHIETLRGQGYRLTGGEEAG